MKAFHYTEIENYPLIVNSGGLEARRKIAEDVSAVFALTSPAPKSWIENKKFPGTFELLMGIKGSLLLEIDTDKLQNENIFIGEWGWLAGLFYADKSKIPEKIHTKGNTF